MRFEDFSFGSIRIDGVTDEHDVVIDRGWVRKRKKKPSKKFRVEFGHTPLSLEEKIPWQCRRLTGNAPVPVPTRQSKANVQFTVRKTMRDAHEEMNTDNSGHVNGSSVHRTLIYSQFDVRAQAPSVDAT